MIFNPKPGEIYELWDSYLTVPRRLIYVLGCYEEKRHKYGDWIKILNLYDYYVEHYYADNNIITNELINDIFLQFKRIEKVDSNEFK